MLLLHAICSVRQMPSIERYALCCAICFDYSHFAGTKLDNLALRTGSYGCVFITRGHVNDTAEATWYGSHNSMDFWEDVMQLDPDEICRLFEQWACSRHQSKSYEVLQLHPFLSTIYSDVAERDTLANVRRQCTRAIQTGLRKLLDHSLIHTIFDAGAPGIGTVTNSKKVKMNYANYETSIVQQMGVRLVGWPKAVKFVNPSQIGTVLEIRTLRDDLKSGACHWIKLTKAQLDVHRADLEERREQGETVGKQRKKRSDAGTSRKRKHHSSEDKENERPSKKHSTKKRTSSRQVKSRMIISDSSSSSDSDDDAE